MWQQRRWKRYGVLLKKIMSISDWRKRKQQLCKMALLAILKLYIIVVLPFLSISHQY